MPDGLDQLLQLIDDGNWHPIGDVAPKLGWNLTRTRQIMILLSEHGLVTYRSSDQAVKIDQDLLNLIKKVEGRTVWLP